jgi:hypothetical protein
VCKYDELDLVKMSSESVEVCTGEDSKSISSVQKREKNLSPLKWKSMNTLNEVENEHKISSLKELSEGDHIIISVDLKRFCHAILDCLDAEKNIIEIIYYDDTQTQCSLNEYMFSREDVCPSATICRALREDKSCRRIGVKYAVLLIDLTKIALYKVDYELNGIKCLPIDEVLEKARKYIGETRYNVFLNNDEHFAIYCKTGKAAKLFIINPSDITAKNIIGKSLSEKVTSTLAQQGGQILLVNTAKHIATKFPRSGVSAGLPAAAETASSFIGVGIESFSVGYDIYQKHKEYKTGQINDTKFKKYIARRVTRGTMSVAGGVAGGIIGQMVIPVPVVGAVVGSLVGGIVGAATGQAEGILIGELVEKIDNKIKENKKVAPFDGSKMPSEDKVDVNLKESESDMKKENEVAYKQEESERPIEERADQKNSETMTDTTSEEKKEFHVIDKLVFKFDKDILKKAFPPQTVDTSSEKSGFKSYVNEVNGILKPNAEIVENLNEKINDEDYEIYVLKDSNEIVTDSQLNVQNCLDPGGSILKRKSIESYSADDLPSDLNVFFKMD